MNYISPTKPAVTGFKVYQEDLATCQNYNPSTNSGSSAPTDASIASYAWNFGDGSTASGKTVPHTYTIAANISATLQVTDNKGAKSTTSIPSTANSLNGLTNLNIELGEVTVPTDGYYL